MYTVTNKIAAKVTCRVGEGALKDTFPLPHDVIISAPSSAKSALPLPPRKSTSCCSLLIGTVQLQVHQQIGSQGTTLDSVLQWSVIGFPWLAHHTLNYCAKSIINAG